MVAILSIVEFSENSWVICAWNNFYFLLRIKFEIFREKNILWRKKETNEFSCLPNFLKHLFRSNLLFFSSKKPFIIHKGRWGGVMMLYRKINVSNSFKYPSNCIVFVTGIKKKTRKFWLISDVYSRVDIIVSWKESF